MLVQQPWPASRRCMAAGKGRSVPAAHGLQPPPPPPPPRLLPPPPPPPLLLPPLLLPPLLLLLQQLLLLLLLRAMRHLPGGQGGARPRSRRARPVQRAGDAEHALAWKTPYMPCASLPARLAALPVACP
jgi:hypothetical protein